MGNRRTYYSFSAGPDEEEDERFDPRKHVNTKVVDVAISFERVDKKPQKNNLNDNRHKPTKKSYEKRIIFEIHHY